MVLLSVYSVVFCGFALGFGAAVLKLTKAVSIWNIRFAPRKNRRRLRIASVVLLSAGIVLFLLNADFIHRLWVGGWFICIALCVCLQAVFLVAGIVCGDFVAAGHREFSEESFSLLGKTDVLREVEQKLKQSFGAVIGLEAIAFVGKDGSVSEVLWFKDFELTQLKSSIQTDILCQYLKRKQLSKEIHSLSNKLSLTLNIGG